MPPNSPCLMIEEVRLQDLKPNPRNPREHSARQIRQLSASVKAFGFNVPLLIDQHNQIVAGHGRARAAERLGMTHVPAIRLEHLSAPQATAFALADNRLTEIATWNDRLLGEVLLDLSALQLDFELDVTGFSPAEIDLHIQGLSEDPDRPDPADAIPTAPDLPPITQLGDLWRLGNHRLLCGNAVDAAAYTTLTGDVRADIVFTDPPYNVPIDGHVSGRGAIRHREFEMASGEMSRPEFICFLSRVIGLLARHSVPGSVHYLCIDWRHVPELANAGQAAYGPMLNICVWVKSNAGLGSFYRSQHELVAVFKNGTSPHRNNIQLGKHGRNRTNVWHYPNVSSFGRAGEEGNLLTLHPTVKPVALIADALLDASRRGDVVLDPFLGSGSTVIAAERVGRRCYGIEIDPLYVDTAIRRWQRWSGEPAILVANGQRFDQLATGRAKSQAEVRDG